MTSGWVSRALTRDIIRLRPSFVYLSISSIKYYKGYPNITEVDQGDHQAINQFKSGTVYRQVRPT